MAENDEWIKRVVQDQVRQAAERDERNKAEGQQRLTLESVALVYWRMFYAEIQRLVEIYSRLPGAVPIRQGKGDDTSQRYRSVRLERAGDPGVNWEFTLNSGSSAACVTWAWKNDDGRGQQDKKDYRLSLGDGQVLHWNGALKDPVAFPRELLDPWLKALRK